MGINGILFIELEYKARLNIVFHDASNHAFVMIAGCIIKDSLGVDDLKEYAEWLRSMAWISRVPYNKAD